MSNNKNPRIKTSYYNKKAMEIITSYAEQKGISFNKACNELVIRGSEKIKSVNENKKGVGEAITEVLIIVREIKEAIIKK